MVYDVLSDLYMYHANIDFICFDSASNLGTDTNPDVNIICVDSASNLGTDTNVT